MISDRWKKICDEVISRFTGNQGKYTYNSLYRKDWIHKIYNICLEIVPNPSLKESEAVFKYLKFYEFFAVNPYVKKDKIIFQISKSVPIKFKIDGKLCYDSKLVHMRLPWHRDGSLPGEIRERQFWNRQVIAPDKVPTTITLTTQQKRATDKFAKKGTHVCQRCGSPIAGKGRHGKKRRGHTQEVCDFFMAKNIMKS